jgi:hypothetical protein
MNIPALIRLWNLTQQSGTSGARVAAGVLLSLYNGPRFPLDLTELRCLDGNYLGDALAVITADASRCEREVHQWLNVITGRDDFGARFEHLAHDWKCFRRGRCKKEYLESLEPAHLFIADKPAEGRS